MSVDVALNELAERIAEYGPTAFVVTVNADGAPHVTSVSVTYGAGVVTTGAGRRTTENVQSRSAVTLLWSAVGGGDYSLLVDGRAVVDADAETLTITPTAAVLHRLASAQGDGPSCIRVLPG